MRLERKKLYFKKSLSAARQVGVPCLPPGRSVILCVLCALWCGVFFAGCQKPLIKESRFLLGTTVQITIKGKEEAKAREAIGLAFKEIERIENLMSKYREGSEISILNREGAKRPVKVSEDTLRVIRESIRIGELTDGAFDITISPLMELWGFSEKEGHLPEEEALREALTLVNYGSISLNEEEGTIRFEKEGMEIDLGGAAKGYGVDRAVEVLRENGISQAIVNAGGDLYLLGKPSGDFWKVGLKHPRKQGEMLGIVKVQDEAVATSGDYENYFILQGKRVCHIIDPASGRPAQGTLSVTVIARESMRADALATALFVLGSEKGLKLASRLEGIEAIIVRDDERGEMAISMTEGLKDRVIILGGKS